MRVGNDGFTGTAADFARIGARAFGAQVRELRKAKGLSQEDLARTLSLSGRSYHQTTIAKLENGSRPTSVEELYVLAPVLGVEVSDFFLPDPEMETRRQIAQYVSDFRWISNELLLVDGRRELLRTRRDEAAKKLQELLSPAEWQALLRGEA